MPGGAAKPRRNLEKEEESMELGILTLLPPIVILLMALKTRNTTSSLLAGALLCCILQYKTGFLTGFIDLMYSVGCNEDTVW